MTSAEREYELVLFGATGYTGKLCAEHIITHLPTDLRWAVAGRSASKLSAVLEELRHLNPNRLQPGIETAALTTEDLTSLARKTRLLINTVGPYYLYSTPVVEACAKNGTHYLDVTGESPWVMEMINKYHDIAKANGAIIIPEIGIESAPSDLLVLSLVTEIREELSVATKEVITSFHELSSTPSGGTLLTALGILDHYSWKEVAKATMPWAMSPVPRPKSVRSTPFMSKLLGVRSVPDLGTLTTSITAGPNAAIVYRSWGLFDGGDFYGHNFEYHEYMRARNAFTGVALHFAIAIGMVALAIPPVRWLLKKLVTVPGQGASREAADKETLELRSVAAADQDGPNPKRALAKLRWEGGMYYLTGVFLAEAAIVILRDDRTKRLGGGLLTPAMLGQPFIDRLRKAGLKLETQLVSY
ncbi:MAG: Saccharopine dehydrogenase Homospermidine synthase [Lasallia pustulata]|uniref:Saccharopine dehydrogenase Homospermidine synthase n=1 Tax=Lasallia pustulata TaxID=136370 RepID=A0A5M8PY64_9LECA|nr:MAG: Saccharopine dehydrogenase Homospermidine synthase [Lasallia pustulata]